MSENADQFPTLFDYLSSLKVLSAKTNESSAVSNIKAEVVRYFGKEHTDFIPNIDLSFERQ